MSNVSWHGSRRRRRLHARIIGALLAIGLGAAACTPTPPGTTTTTPASSTTTSSTTTSSAGVTTTTVGYSGYVTIDGRRVGVPEEGSRPINPVQGVGEQIIITPKAIEPHFLYCQVDLKLTFTNLTSVPQELVFVNDGGWRSPKIPPGGKWIYTPRNGISFYYVTKSGLQARFQASAPLPGNP
jgi:hypothetical protein